MFLAVAILLIMIPAAVFAEGNATDSGGSEVSSDCAGESFDSTTTANTVDVITDSSPPAETTSNNADPVPSNDPQAAIQTSNDTTPEELTTDDPSGDMQEESVVDTSGEQPTTDSAADVEEPAAVESAPAEGKSEPASGDIEVIPASGGNSYTAEITSERVVASGTEHTAFTVVFTETGYTEKLGSAQLSLPEGFSDLALALGSIQATGDKVWHGSVVDLVLTLWAHDEASYLGVDDPFEDHESVTATFSSTTPTETGIYTFETNAWTDNAAQDVFDTEGVVVNKNIMAAGQVDPTVGVLHKTNPFHVGTPEELDAVRLNLTASYLQTADIDLADYLAPGGAGYNDGKGWVPIVRTDPPPPNEFFSGTFDGNGFTISNLYINNSYSSRAGLFGGISGATLQNIKLLDINVISSTGSGGAAGLVGISSNSIIKNCSVTGAGINLAGALIHYSEDSTVENCYAIVQITESENGYTGGLIGNMVGGTITDSYAIGNVKGSRTCGGLVGAAGYDVTIINSYASVEVISDANTGPWSAGGLIGQLGHSVIKDSYATGNVTGGNRTGGLIGWILEISNIENSYATGNVNGNDFVGGLVGNCWEGTISNSFWSTDNNFGLPGVGFGSDAGATGKTTAQMQTLSFHRDTLGWDIAGQDGNYPVLGWQVGWEDNTWYLAAPPTDPDPDPTPSPDPAPTPDPWPTPPIAPTPIQPLLGQLSAKHESNGNPGSISGGHGDFGGASYGAYQFASKFNVPYDFAQWLANKNPVYHRRLIEAYSADGNTYGSNFNRVWKAIAEEKPGIFLQLQHEYVKVTYYDRTVQKLINDLGLDVNRYSIALQNVVWSRSVQHGWSAAANVIKNALIGINLSQATEVQLIRAIYAESGRAVDKPPRGDSIPMHDGKYMKYFSRNSANVQQSVWNRLNISELNDALRMLQ